MSKFGNKIQGAGPAPLLREPAGVTLTEADHKAAETEQEDADRLAAVARREADEAETEAKARLGVTPTVALSSSNPPPPENPAQPPRSATTEEVNAYLEGMDAEEAEAAKAAKTKPADVVTIPPPPAASAPPDPPQWVRVNPRVSMPAVTEQQVRFSEKLPRIVFGGLVILFAIFLAATFAVGVYLGLSRTMPSLTALTQPTHPTMGVSPTHPAMAQNPEPTIPYGLLPPGAEPGLLGVPGTRVRMSARAAFPTRCASALTANWSDDVRFLCGRDQRRGNNLCNCDVTGLVP